MWQTGSLVWKFENQSQSKHDTVHTRCSCDKHGGTHPPALIVDLTVNLFHVSRNCKNATLFGMSGTAVRLLFWELCHRGQYETGQLSLFCFPFSFCVMLFLCHCHCLSLFLFLMLLICFFFQLHQLRLPVLLRVFFLLDSFFVFLSGILLFLCVCVLSLFFVLCFSISLSLSFPVLYLSFSLFLYTVSCSFPFPCPCCCSFRFHMFFFFHLPVSLSF